MLPSLKEMQAEYVPFTKNEDANRHELVKGLEGGSLEPWVAGIATPGGGLLRLLQAHIPDGCWISGVELYEQGANFFVKENRYAGALGFIRVRAISSNGGGA